MSIRLDSSSCVPIRLFPLFHSRHVRVKKVRLLFVFMTILAQSFFTLVGSHFVAFTFLSVWHSRKNVILYYIMCYVGRIRGIRVTCDITSPDP